MPKIQKSRKKNVMPHFERVKNSSDEVNTDLPTLVESISNLSVELNDEIDNDDSFTDDSSDSFPNESESDTAEEFDSQCGSSASSSGKRVKRGRKSKFDDQNRVMRKRRNSNERYYSSNGKIIQPVNFKDFVCCCSNECNSKIPVDDRQKFFSHYWDLKDYNTQTAFLSSVVKETNVKRRTVNALVHTRNFSRVYTINRVTVCKSMFLNTLGISEQRVNSALSKARSLLIPDRRGVAGGHNKMTEEQKNGVINHINKFPRYKSHYCRAQQSEQEYLPVGTTIALMHRLYKEENSNPVSESAYRKIFKTDFNLKTKALQKDTCNKCDSYDISIKNTAESNRKEQLIFERDAHQKRAEIARKCMKVDLKRAAKEDNIETLTFDMEKTLPLPRINTNVIYYKRQVCLYNCGIYAGKSEKSTFNVWIEGQAGRGAQEVGSCLRKYIKEHVHASVDELILWSDSCGGQNRNIKIVLLLKSILENSSSLKSIELKFLVSGHSYLPNDSDFGDVECALKKQQKLYTPNDYLDVMRQCRKKNPLVINLMETEDFVSTQSMEKKIINRKKCSDGEKVNWFHIRQIKIVKDQPFNILVKMSHEIIDDYKKIDIKKRGKKFPTNNIFTENLNALWPSGKAVAQAKLNDIKSYMHLIPEVDHGFYNKLIGDDRIEEDIDGYNGELDFQFEIAEIENEIPEI